MRLFGDNCEKCMNRINCQYRDAYEHTWYKLRAFMYDRQDLEFYGSVRMHCDYYAHDASMDIPCRCG